MALRVINRSSVGRILTVLLVSGSLSVMCQAGDSELADARSVESDFHWAFAPIAHPTPPSVEQEGWVQNGIDNFVLRKLELHSLRPSPKADKRTLIRRVYLDLLGLPPSPADVERFLADHSVDAFERLVDQLLQSPHYGERWGRHWLDMARYADSHGYDMDQPRPHAWRYRQWVIEALNKDLPFDEFTIDQLAGDLLAHQEQLANQGPTNQEQLIATGFHRNAPKNTEFGVDEVEDQLRRAMDRANTTATTWLGLTMQCSRCHDHKYDPLSQREYFGLVDFFNHLDEKEIVAPLPVDVEVYAEKRPLFDKAYLPLLEMRADFESQVIPPRRAAWEAALPPPTAAKWNVLQPSSASSYRGDELNVLADSSILATGFTPNDSIYTIVAPIASGSVSAIRLEVLPDPSLPQGGPGRAPDGDFDLYQFKARIGYPTDPSDSQSFVWEDVELMNPLADFSKEGRGIENALGSYGKKVGWSIGPRTGERHVAVFELRQPIEDARGMYVCIDIGQGTTDWFQVIGRFRLATTATTVPFRIDEIPDSIGHILATKETKRNAQQRMQLRRYYCSRDPDWMNLSNIVEQFSATAPVDPELTLARVLGKPVDVGKTFILNRGDFTEPGEAVTAHTPAVLPTLPARGAVGDRLDLARWLVSPTHPLTSRVTVNRVWQRYFGRGLVFTDDDFGVNGMPPTHPELLDWLASEFRDNGWSLKQLHRLIVTSATYQQSSQFRTEVAQMDPDNELMARQSRIRLDAEVIRDSALAVSGLLNRQLGGPSVVLAQPSGGDDLAFSRSKHLGKEGDIDQKRRSVYIWAQRTVPYPMFSIFDVQSSSVTCTRRPRSKTPMQALTLLNDRSFFECSQSLARRITSSDDLLTTPPNAARMDQLFQRCLSRSPSDAEKAELQHWQAEYGRLEANATNADTWVMLSRIILNLEEFVVRE